MKNTFEGRLIKKRVFYLRAHPTLGFANHLVKKVLVETGLVETFLVDIKYNNSMRLHLHAYIKTDHAQKHTQTHIPRDRIPL